MFSYLPSRKLYLIFLIFHDAMITTPKKTDKPETGIIYSNQDDVFAGELLETAEPDRPGCRLGVMTRTCLTSVEVVFSMYS